MVDSLLGKALKVAPLGIASATLFGLEHAPKFTIEALLTAGSLTVAERMDQLDLQKTAANLSSLMAECGPWKRGPETADKSQAALKGLPTDRYASVMVDPYYFNPMMTYTEASFNEASAPLYAYGYRLNPCGVFALNYNPMADSNALLIESVVLVAFFRGTDMQGEPLLFTAMWKEGLPLGAECHFGMPHWGILRRAADPATVQSVLGMYEELLRVCVNSEAEQKAGLSWIAGKDVLPTMIERGFPNLRDTVWFGTEPFPALDNFEYELIGADFRQREVSVPLWFRPARGILG